MTPRARTVSTPAIDESAPVAAPTMRHEVVDDAMLVVEGPRALAPEEWSALCRASATLDFRGVLVVADRGPGPTSRQRTELAETLRRRGHFPNVAVVTDSPAHRGSITVMNWMQTGTLKAYGPARLGEALNYAGVAPSARALMLRRVHELATHVNAPWILRTIPLDSAHEMPP